jgi:hypothetical protein
MSSFQIVHAKYIRDESGWPLVRITRNLRVRLDSEVYKDRFDNLMELPTNPDDFGNDRRIWKEDGVYHLVDDYQEEWEFNEELSKWNKLANHVVSHPDPLTARQGMNSLLAESGLGRLKLCSSLNNG